VQVDPIKPTLKPPGTKRLKLKYEKLVSSFGFNVNLRRYIKGKAAALDLQNIDTDMIIPKQFLKTIKRTGLGVAAFYGRGLHSFTLELNLSNSRTHSGLRWVTQWTEVLNLS
jgi:hypothetical protein